MAAPAEDGGQRESLGPTRAAVEAAVPLSYARFSWGGRQAQGFDFPMENEKILEKMRNFSIFHIFHVENRGSKKNSWGQKITFYATFPVAPAVCCRL